MPGMERAGDQCFPGPLRVRLIGRDAHKRNPAKSDQKLAVKDATGANLP